jgi:hypothetical protein
VLTRWRFCLEAVACPNKLGSRVMLLLEMSSCLARGLLYLRSFRLYFFTISVVELLKPALRLVLIHGCQLSGTFLQNVRQKSFGEDSSETMTL